MRYNDSKIKFSIIKKVNMTGNPNDYIEVRESRAWLGDEEFLFRAWTDTYDKYNEVPTLDVEYFGKYGEWIGARKKLKNFNEYDRESVVIWKALNSLHEELKLNPDSILKVLKRYNLEEY